MWIEHEEQINLEQGFHLVVYKNKQTGAEHHLLNHIHLDSCPHCGHVKPKEIVDFQQVKADTLQALNDHHKASMKYAAKFPHARLVTK